MKISEIIESTDPAVVQAVTSLMVAVTIVHGEISPPLLGELFIAKTGGVSESTAISDFCRAKAEFIENIPYGKRYKAGEYHPPVVYECKLIPGKEAGVAIMMARLSDNPTVREALEAVEQAAGR